MLKLKTALHVLVFVKFCSRPLQCGAASTHEHVATDWRVAPSYNGVQHRPVLQVLKLQCGIIRPQSCRV
jgi:hypothetical protein